MVMWNGQQFATIILTKILKLVYIQSMEKYFFVSCFIFIARIFINGLVAQDLPLILCTRLYKTNQYQYLEQNVELSVNICECPEYFIRPSMAFRK